MHDASRRQVLVATAVACSLAFGGCLTLNPTISANTTDSTVFEGFSVNESMVSNRVDVSASLTPTATTTGDVTQISVIGENGETVSTTMVAAGQTSVTLSFPTNQNATVVAIDAVNGTTIETRNVTTTGNELF